MVCAYTEKSQLPWYALIVGLVFAFLWLPFYGAMNAVTGYALRARVPRTQLKTTQMDAVRHTAVPDARLGRHPWLVPGEHVL
jgi:hypothetical protein